MSLPIFLLCLPARKKKKEKLQEPHYQLGHVAGPSFPSPSLQYQEQHQEHAASTGGHRHTARAQVPSLNIAKSYAKNILLQQTSS